jgi:cyclopropane fatty-acyl-phospholipid synthase-like methyltransferase
MVNNWQTIWNRRVLGSEANVTLETLIRLDGFDSGAGYISVRDSRAAVARTAGLLDIQDGESVFEFGVGGGAFLFGLNELRRISGGGVDYSLSLIEVARRALPKFEFICAEAKDVPSQPQMDHAISHSMFHYFDLPYAERVLECMTAKARKTISILEVPDEATREAAERFRAAQMAPEEYRQKYADLPHQYYKRQWFQSQAKKLGLSCQFIDNQITNYAQKDFRYGCVMRKC